MGDLEALILARVPQTEYGKLCLVNKRFLSLVKSGEIYRIRRHIGVREPTVFMLAAGAHNWWAFDRRFDRLRTLPLLPADDSFRNGDKETFCAGTHLLVSGKELGVSVVWRYDLVHNRWLRGPSMISPRSLFAGVTCGSFVYVAGGVSQTVIGAEAECLSSAERYNPESGEWEVLPSMHRKRRNCAGCYMDDRFYVIGGRNDRDGALTCAEAYDAERSTWELIPHMLEHAPALAPPLLAAVNNELYSLDASTNQLKVYVKRSNSWRNLGPAPVIAGSAGGWGVAFKSLGDELLVIGGSRDAYVGRGMIYTCQPDPKAEVLNWRSLEYGDNQLNPFILNCSVMFT